MRAPKATITQRVLDSALTFAPSLSRQEPSIPWLHAWPLLALVRGCVLHPGVLRSCLVPTPPCSEWLFPAGERKLLVPLADTAPGTRSVFFPAGQFWPPVLERDHQAPGVYAPRPWRSPLQTTVAPRGCPHCGLRCPCSQAASWLSKVE